MTHTIQQLASALNLTAAAAGKNLNMYHSIVRLSPQRGPRNATIITEAVYQDILNAHDLAVRLGISLQRVLLLRAEHRETLSNYLGTTGPSSSRLQDPELEKLRASHELTQQKLDQLLARPSSAPDYQPFAEDIQQIKRNQEDLLRALRTKQSTSPVPAPAPVTKE